MWDIKIYRRKDEADLWEDITLSATKGKFARFFFFSFRKLYNHRWEAENDARLISIKERQKPKNRNYEINTLVSMVHN